MHMIALIQRVSSACVEIDGRTRAEIGRGMLVFLCVVKGDCERDTEYIVRKVSQLRIFDDADGRMNLSIKDISGDILVVSQFTLAADAKKGNRPSFDRVESPGRAEGYYESFIRMLGDLGLRVHSGVFGASMKIFLVNNGPVTIYLDSREGRGWDESINASL